ncbi:MAG: malectin domain-containing carbohydrate-binding protein [Patescibacteria group bacterium]|mgnify:CR=1 FL=1
MKYSLLALVIFLLFSFFFLFSPDQIGVAQSPGSNFYQAHISTTTGKPWEEVTVTWKTSSLTPSALRLGTIPGVYTITTQSVSYDYPSVDTLGRFCCMHVAQVTGLIPATTYYYQVENSGVMSREMKFKTAPAKGDKRPFTFVAIADQSWDEDRPSTRPIPVASSIKQDNPELIIVAGDLFYGNMVEVDRFFDNVIHDIASGAYYMTAPGNHEMYSPDAAVTYLNRFSYPGRPIGDTCTSSCRQKMPEMWYSFDWGNVHFTSIDLDLDHSKVFGGSGKVQPGEARYEWFKNDLANAYQDKLANNIDWSVVYTHFCFYNWGYDDSHASDDEARAVLEDLLEQYKVDLFVCGHQHSYERTFPVANNGNSIDAVSCGGTPGVAYASCTNPQYPIYLMPGTAGRSLYNPGKGQGDPDTWGTAANPTQWSAFRNNHHFGHARVTVNGGEMTVEFVAMPDSLVENQPYNSTATPGRFILDRFTITKTGLPSPSTPTLNVSPTTLTFSGVQGGSNPANQSITVSNTGGGTMNWTASSNANWLTINPIAGTNNGTITASVSTAGLSTGSYNGVITITSTGAQQSPKTVAVSLTVTSSGPAPSGSTTTTGVLNLASTYASVSVYTDFTDDTNGNNQALLEYRKAGNSAWSRGMDMTVDRRSTVTGGPNIFTNTFKNQWRASILLVEPDTGYEVRVSFADPDGVSGTNPLVKTIRTRKETAQIPSTARSLYVSTSGNDTSGDGSEANPWRTIQKASDNARTGDTVYVKAGTYGEAVQIKASGTSDNYITFRNFGNDRVVINPPGDSTVIAQPSMGVLITGSYIRFKGFEILDSNGAILINDDAHDVIIEDNLLKDYHRTGLRIGGKSTGLGGWAPVSNVANVTVQRNKIFASIADPPDDLGGINSCCYNKGGHVIRYNHLEYFYTGLENNRTHGEDCIVSSPNFEYGDVYKDTDIYGNMCIGATDDGIEMDGNDVNTRVWGNTIVGPNLGISISPAIVGPAYVFRNVLYGPQYQWAGCVGIKEGENGTGHVFFYHNTFYWNTGACPGASGVIISDAGDRTPSTNLFLKNNVYYFEGRGISINDPGGKIFSDYNLNFDKDGGIFAKYEGPTYDSLAALRAATGLEMNGISAMPLFADAANRDFRLLPGSPGIDGGVLIPGFNDQDSAWPYRGSAPDMGAFEVEGGIIATPVLNVSPSSLIFSATQGGSNPSSQTLSVSNTGAGSMAWTASSNASWLTINPTTGTNNGTVTVSISTAGLAVGSYNGIITVTANGAQGSPKTVSVALVVSAGGSPPPTSAILIEAGGIASYTDSQNRVWGADRGFVAGNTVDRGPIAIANTLDDKIYQTERWGMSGYALTVPNGRYTVKLHFAETYTVITGAGQRVFNVTAEGISINRVDPFAETGGRNIALVKTVTVDVVDGQLNIAFTPVLEAPEINGIEIIGASSFSPERSHLFLDKPDDKFVIRGSNIPLSDTFKFLLKEGSLVRLSTPPLVPKDSSTIEFDFSDQSQTFSALPPAFYTMELQRSDTTILLQQQVLLTKHGDLPDSSGNRDGDIDIDDVSFLLSRWGRTDSTSLDFKEFDINAGPSNVSQGKIDIFDANRLMANWTG